MAKQCWKKTVENKDNTIYRADRDKSVFIESPSSTFTHTSKWVVKTYKKFLQIDVKKEFKNESQALKFAKSYMKKHNRC